MDPRGDALASGKRAHARLLAGLGAPEDRPSASVFVRQAGGAPAPVGRPLRSLELAANGLILPPKKEADVVNGAPPTPPPEKGDPPEPKPEGWTGTAGKVAKTAGKVALGVAAVGAAAYGSAYATDRLADAAQDRVRRALRNTPNAFREVAREHPPFRAPSPHRAPPPEEDDPNALFDVYIPPSGPSSRPASAMSGVEHAAGGPSAPAEYPPMVHVPQPAANPLHPLPGAFPGAPAHPWLERPRRPPRPTSPAGPSLLGQRRRSSDAVGRPSQYRRVEELPPFPLPYDPAAPPLFQAGGAGTHRRGPPPPFPFEAGSNRPPGPPAPSVLGPRRRDPDSPEAGRVRGHPRPRVVSPPISVHSTSPISVDSVSPQPPVYVHSASPISVHSAASWHTADSGSPVAIAAAIPPPSPPPAAPIADRPDVVVPRPPRPRPPGLNTRDLPVDYGPRDPRSRRYHYPSVGARGRGHAERHIRADRDLRQAYGTLEDTARTLLVNSGMPQSIHGVIGTRAHPMEWGSELPSAQTLRRYGNPVGRQTRRGG